MTHLLTAAEVTQLACLECHQVRVDGRLMEVQHVGRRVTRVLILGRRGPESIASRDLLTSVLS